MRPVYESRPARGRARPPSDLLEGGEALEEPVARVDLGPGEGEQPVQAEGLHAEGGEGAAHDDGPAQGGLVDRGRAGQVAEEPAREGVPRPRGIEDLLQ